VAGHPATGATPSRGLAPFPLEPRWIGSLPEPLIGPPVFDDEHAYIGLRSGKLLAASLGDGAIRWTADVEPPFVVAAGPAGAIVANGSTVRAFDASAGRMIWSVQLTSPALAVGLHGDRMIVGTTDGDLIALHTADGRPVWRQAIGGRLGANPVISGDRVVVSLDDGRVACLNLADGATAWTRRLTGRPARVHVSGRHVYVGTSDNFFYCLGLETGDRAWRWRTGADIVGEAVTDERRVFFLSLDNVLRALDARHGAQRWKRLLPFRPIGAPTLVGETIVVAGQSARLLGFRVGDGAAVGQFDAAAELAAPPYAVTVDGGHDFVIVTNDALLRLKRSFDPPLAPLDYLPGRRIPREPPPIPTREGL
jgi:outer membrane protein assembly factor BamB